MLCDLLRLSFGDNGVSAYGGPYRLKLFDETAERYLPKAHRRGQFNALSGKSMVEPDFTAPRNPRDLAALFHLAEPPGGGWQEISVRRLSGAELARTLIASTMNHRYESPERLARQLKFAARVARALPVYALGYPRRFDVMDEVLAHLRRAVA